jgi:hypothetical protein
VGVRKEAEARRGRVAAADTASLLRHLHDGTQIQREAAVARLRVIGRPAFTSLARLIHQAQLAPTARAAALAALEGMDEPRAVPTACAALDTPDDAVALAAIAVLRGWVTHEHGIGAVEALTVAALDRARGTPVRLAALDALSELPPHLVAPVRATSALEPSPPPTSDAARSLEWLARFDDTASLSAVHEVLSAAREAERGAPSERQQRDWARVRAAAHLALATRGSRLGLYDLRDTFSTATQPLPLDLLTALARVGDEHCLEPLARAWTAAADEPWWQARLAEAAADLIGRCGLSGRHAVVKRLRVRWPAFTARVAAATPQPRR